MARGIILSAFVIAACVRLAVDAAVVEKTFIVGNLTYSALCEPIVITAVNGQLPGPTLDVTTGDNLIIHVVNQSPYNLTIHWHGVTQRGTPWADGPEMVAQCPIMSGNNYTYNFTVADQEGTLFYHAHITYLRATVYGAIIIRPKGLTHRFSQMFDFELPPIVIGEWWNANVEDVFTEGYLQGGVANISDAYTINGLPGDLFPCSNGTLRLSVAPNKIYLLRIINAALSTHHFFKIAGHSLTVIAVDGKYTTPYTTDVIVIASGQTVDALLFTTATPGNYYMAVEPYSGTIGILPFDNNTATAIISYTTANQTAPPVMPLMPAFNDYMTTFTFLNSLTSLPLPGSPTVPTTVNETMFITFGLGLQPCAPAQIYCNQTTGAPAASMNNISFVLPSMMSILEAHYKNVSGVYTTDFPNTPPVVFNYTDITINFNPLLLSLLFPEKGTKVKQLAYNTSVEIVLQNTAILGPDFHPIHLHGYSFFIVAQGFGNYNATEAVPTYNLVNPQYRHTVLVPAGGWSVIRFVADNPGVWLMHCHMEQHVPLGLMTVFQVDDGPTSSTMIPSPPADYPRC